MPDDARERGSLTLLIGGARSGKSLHAETLTTALPAPWLYIATAQAFDDEMRERIGLHQTRRAEGWQTIDAPVRSRRSARGGSGGRPVLVDCLTLWLTNHMLAEHDLAREADALVTALARPRGPWFVVSNEVGLGIVPDNALARRFRDAAGRLNAQVAKVADRVLFMVAACR